LDSTSSRRPVPSYSEGLRGGAGSSSKPLHGKRLGLIRETLGQGVAPGVQEAVMQVRGRGAMTRGLCGLRASGVAI